MSDTSAVLNKWLHHPFFSPNTVVLGLDIGIEGIGIAVRKGSELIHCETLMVDLPEAAALATRRTMRAARHARKNQRVRMHRLQKLFAAHGLPWVSDEVSAVSDPFKLRYRAITKHLASREALSLCIRACVERRGYDYFAMSRENGSEYLWGTTPELTEAKKWLSTAYIDEALSQQLKGLATELVFKGKPLEDNKIAEWNTLVDERASKAAELGIPAMLAEYNRNKCSNYRRARGFNFPRAHVEQHLRTILERHRELIDGYEGFVNALFLPNDTAEHKRRSIFHYNRKTKEEAEACFERKVKQCPYCEWLGIPQENCGLKADQDIRHWALLDFVANRRFELSLGKIPQGRRLLSEDAVRTLKQTIDTEVRTWAEAKKALEKTLAPLSFTKKSEWNDSQFEQLKDIVTPSGIVRQRRAAISVGASRKLVELVTKNGSTYVPEQMEAARREMGLYEKRATIETTGGIYPQVQCLLGTLRKRNRAKHGNFAVPGRLQRLFEGPLAPYLDGKTCPDYCIIECVRNAPANLKQRAERETDIKKNRKRREEQATRYDRKQLTKSESLRLRLFEEQGGSPQTEAICPFTGQKLGTDPFSAELELAHLYPDSRGGLYIAENLVLTTRQTNAAMNNLTPREASAAHLQQWQPWEEQLRTIEGFRWGKFKRELFCFEPKDGITFPDFNNMTRTAQLAAELRRMAAVWMGIEGDAEALRQRIGNPSGAYTAAARRGMLWDQYDKDRSNNLHHRLDAAVMTCIPPAEGINDVQYGGIFHTIKISGNRRFTCIEGLPLPDFREEWFNPKGCPVVRQISHSKAKSLGDSTFWRVNEAGLTAQRTALQPGAMTASDIHTALGRMHVPAELIPTERQIQAWLTECQQAVKGDTAVPAKPLRLLNGTPIRNIWKFGKKGNLDKSPLGWSGIITPEGAFDQMRKLTATNDRLEIWLGYDTKKKDWSYYRHIIPAQQALIGLKRLGFPWRGRDNAHGYLLDLLQRMKKRDLHELVCGPLPKGARKVGTFRKYQTYRMDFRVDPDAIEKLRNTKEHFDLNDHPAVMSLYGEVTAINASGKIEFKCITHKDRKKLEISSPLELASLLGLPQPAALAATLGLTPTV